MQCNPHYREFVPEEIGEPFIELLREHFKESSTSISKCHTPHYYKGFLAYGIFDNEKLIGYTMSMLGSTHYDISVRLLSTGSIFILKEYRSYKNIKDLLKNTYENYREKMKLTHHTIGHYSSFTRLPNLFKKLGYQETDIIYTKRIL